jgi:hypothetical protein
MMKCEHTLDEPCRGVFTLRVGFAIARPPTPRNIRFRHVAVAACDLAQAEQTAIAMLCAMDDEHTRDHQVSVKGHTLTKAYPATIGHLPGRIEMPTSTELLHYCE